MIQCLPRFSATIGQIVVIKPSFLSPQAWGHNIHSNREKYRTGDECDSQFHLTPPTEFTNSMVPRMGPITVLLDAKYWRPRWPSLSFVLGDEGCWGMKRDHPSDRPADHDGSTMRISKTSCCCGFGRESLRPSRGELARRASQGQPKGGAAGSKGVLRTAEDSSEA